jgi:cytochrome c556
MIARTVLVAVVTFAATVVVAQQDPITTRKGLMKEIGGANRTFTEILDGKEPFDVAKVKAALMVINQNATKIIPLFPDNSKNGDTAALPALWENKADFDAKLAKFSVDAKEAADKTTDLASLKAAIGPLRENCGGCHKPYRRPST